MSKRFKRRLKAFKKQFAMAEGRGPKRKSFYQTREWKELRYAVLVEFGARCQCCGVTAKDGAKINVDHIKPISKAWHLRLDRSNLQVLCGSCNQGKNAHDQTDWRPDPVEAERELIYGPLH